MVYTLVVAWSHSTDNGRVSFLDTLLVDQKAHCRYRCTRVVGVAGVIKAWLNGCLAPRAGKIKSGAKWMVSTF